MSALWATVEPIRLAVSNGQSSQCAPPPLSAPHRYKEAGPAGSAAFEAGVEGFEAKAFRGCGIVTSDPFEVSDDMEAVQMLQRFTQVGEFYIVEQGKNISIYDEECDKYKEITYADALAASGAVDLKEANKGNDASGKPKFNFNKDDPIIVVRPFIEHAMLSAVLAVAGSDTGATCFGPSGTRRLPTQLQFCHASCTSLTCLRVFLVRRHAAFGQHLRQDDRGCVLQRSNLSRFLTCTPLSCPQATIPATSRRSSPSRRTCV